MAHYVLGSHYLNWAGIGLNKVKPLRQVNEKQMLFLIKLRFLG
jgi:hypothetical protein